MKKLIILAMGIASVVLVAVYHDDLKELFNTSSKEEVLEDEEVENLEPSKDDWKVAVKYVCDE